MKISIVIPCIPRHFMQLHNVLQKLHDGTRVPDEVVVVLTESNRIHVPLIDSLREIGKTFFPSFVVVTLPHVTYSGPARQAGSVVSTGEVIIYQDADDIPHKQRVEVLEHFFNTTDALHINHAYYHNVEATSPPICIGDIHTVPSQTVFSRYFPTGSIAECVKTTFSYGDNLGFTFPLIHVGATSVRREVLGQVSWKDVSNLSLVSDPGLRPRTEDYEFCMEVLHKFNRSLLLDAQLYYYYK